VDSGILFDVGTKVFVKIGDYWKRGTIRVIRKSKVGYFYDVKMESGITATFHRSDVKLAE
jgi:hypothetical protein